MCVVGAHVSAIVTSQLLKPHPNVGLQVLDQVADVDVPVGVGQGGGDEQAAGHGEGMGNAEFGMWNLQIGAGRRAGRLC